MKELTLKEIQKASLQILKEVARICSENNIRYSLGFGTLIGAIRHKGFIPWDDDIDIVMPRPDYDRFLKYMYDNKDKEKLKVFNRDTVDDYPYGITRICDTDYLMDTYNINDCGMGTFIDIYPFDGIGSGYETARNLMNEAFNYSSRICSAHLIRFRIPRTFSIKQIWKAYKYFRESHKIGAAFYFDKIKEIVSSLDYDNSILVGCPSWTLYRCVWKKEWVENLELAQFENEQFFIPVDYDEILRSIYGDYMQLPAEKDRIPHHDYKIYRKNISKN